ncbi:MAG: thermonuclease family protein [Candidatus Aenigmatarchaeota archaeon]
MKKGILLVIVVVVLGAMGYILLDLPGSEIVPDIRLQGESAVIDRVIDGDTVELENGDKVRLLGIDTPEKGQLFYGEATRWLEERVLNKEVWLEPGKENKDKYDRFLRYIFVGSTFINLELVKTGYATSYIFEEDQYSEVIREAEQEARRDGLGLWGVASLKAFCLGIYNFHYNAKGDDNENLNDEYIEFRNKCTHPIQITGWVLFDSKNTIYRVPNVTVMNKTIITVHTGTGQNTEEDLFWGLERAVWNNDGDKLTMLDAEGNGMLEYEY